MVDKVEKKTCPKCSGFGEIFFRDIKGNIYEAKPCGACSGTGNIKK